MDRGGLKMDEKIIELRRKLTEFVAKLERNRINRILAMYGYISLADVEINTNEGDDEAKAILNWYKNYDDKLWGWVEEVIKKREPSLNEDPVAIEDKIFKETQHLLPVPDFIE